MNLKEDDDKPGPESRDNSSTELDTDSEPQVHLTARDQARGPFKLQSPLVRRRPMTPQLARQKASDLSYEIGALKKIQERLERKRERLLMYLTPSRNSDLI